MDLDAANTYTGGTTIDSGQLDLGAAGAAGSGDITFGAGGSETLDFSIADAPTGNVIEGFAPGDTIDITDLATPANFGANVHMTSPDPDDPLAFDYRLKPGVNPTTNALAVLRMMGLDT